MVERPEHPGMVGRPVYLDYNATTPVDPRVAAAMQPGLTTDFSNASSAHYYGDEPRRLLAAARAQVAALVGATGDEVVFTGSGSKADTLAVRGASGASQVTRPASYRRAGSTVTVGAAARVGG